MWGQEFLVDHEAYSAYPCCSGINDMTFQGGRALPVLEVILHSSHSKTSTILVWKWLGKLRPLHVQLLRSSNVTATARYAHPFFEVNLNSHGMTTEQGLLYIYHRDEIQDHKQYEGIGLSGKQIVSLPLSNG